MTFGRPSGRACVRISKQEGVGGGLQGVEKKSQKEAISRTGGSACGWGGGVKRPTSGSNGQNWNFQTTGGEGGVAMSWA